MYLVEVGLQLAGLIEVVLERGDRDRHAPESHPYSLVALWRGE
jgi:hypothetical protein